MSDTKISEATVSLACGAWLVESAKMRGGDHDCMRAALEAALPHLHPQPAELAEPSGNSGEMAEQQGAGKRKPQEIAAILRAMSINYAHGHVWDHLDAEVCREAADALAATGKQQGVALRYLTQSELDSIGSQAEGMDGEQWDRWVQARFAEVNGFTTVDSDGFTAIATTGNQQVGEAQADAVEHAKNLDLLRAGYHVDAQPRAAALDAAIAALAARQPGAQLPVASIDPRHLFLMAGKDGTLSGNVLRFGASMQPGDAPLYAALPAQGIDLEQLGQLSESWLSQADRVKSASPSKAAAMWACAKELRDTIALIDQRDAAPGVGS